MAARLRSPSLVSRLVGSVLVVAGLLTGTGCAHFSRLDLTSTGRDVWQRPEDVVEQLGLEPGAKVADLGAGEGYFVPYLAEAVGAEGKVYAVEADEDRAEDLYARFVTAPNVEVVRGHDDDPGLPDGEIDLVLIVDRFHRIADREVYFRHLINDLAPGGRVAVIEPDPELHGLLRAFVDRDQATPRWQVEVEMAHAGYTTIKSVDELLPMQIFEIYAPEEAVLAVEAP